MKAKKNQENRRNQNGPVEAGATAVSAATAPDIQADKRIAAVTRADTFLGFVSKLMTVIFGLSTISLWAFNSFYVGELRVQTASPAPGEITVKLYDDRGKESEFHTESIKIAPGSYQVAVNAEGCRPIRTRARVEFNRTTTVALAKAAPSDNPGGGPNQESARSNRRWWQFWRRG